MILSSSDCSSVSRTSLPSVLRASGRFSLGITLVASFPDLLM